MNYLGVEKKFSAASRGKKKFRTNYISSEYPRSTQIHIFIILHLFDLPLYRDLVIENYSGPKTVY